MDYVWLDDKMLKRTEALISFDDRGYYFGDGIYEVIRIYNGSLFLFSDHMKRFSRSAAELDMTLPYDENKMKDIISRLIEKNNVRNGIVYFQLTRGLQPRDHLYTRDLKPVLSMFTREMDTPRDEIENGISMWMLEDIRWLRCDIKTINLLGNVMAKRKAEDNGCQEALQHRGCTVTEGSSSNVFFVKNGTLYTHPANNYILNGITRQHVLRLAEENDISCIEKAFSLDDIPTADEIFITSTGQEVIPVTQLKGTLESTFNIGPITKKLQQLFRHSIEN